MMKRKSSSSAAMMKLSAFAGTGIIMVLAVSAVTAVQAYLAAQTDVLENEFSSMQITYTNTDIDEPKGSTFEYTGSTDKNVTINGVTKTAKAVTIDKEAQIVNPKGTDRKPVFVRAAVTLAVYDDSTDHVDVTTDYPCQLCDLTLGSGWEKKADGYYYYKKIVIPGDGNDSKTTDLFGGADVTFTEPEALPANYKVEVHVIADTIQAVATDDVDWTAADYIAEGVSSVQNEVQTAWKMTPTVAAVTGDDAAKQVATTVTWAASS